MADLGGVAVTDPDQVRRRAGALSKRDIFTLADELEQLQANFEQEAMERIQLQGEVIYLREVVDTYEKQVDVLHEEIEHTYKMIAELRLGKK
jgi:uncharacterized protein YlxW (UPF0749 family)